MIAHLLLRRINNNHELWPRDFKQADECVYSLDSPLPIKAVTSNREYPNSSAREYLTPGSAREYLDPVGNKGSHSIYFFILKQRKPKCNLPAKIKGCENPSAATYAKTNNLVPTKAVKSIENTSTQLERPSTQSGITQMPRLRFPAQKQRVPYQLRD